MKKKALLTLIIMWIINEVYSQTDFQNYDYNCYCRIDLSQPKDIIEKGNNWQILKACVNGFSFKEMDKVGINYSIKQIEILQAFNLLKYTDNKYYTQFPILENSEITNLRYLTKQYAESIIQKIQIDFSKVSGILQKNGYENNIYTILFSYIMDDLVWRNLEEHKDISKQLETTTDSPFWVGTLWFINPKRLFSCGTNSLTDSIYRVSINWTENETVSFSKYNVLSQMLKDYINKERIIDEKTKSVLLTYELCDNNGLIKLPIIKKSKSDSVYYYSKNIASEISQYLISNIDYISIQTKYHINTRENTIIILYHEIMWDILELLENKGQIKKPITFTGKKNTKITDLKNVMYISEK